jgi:hypothetical protein
MDNDFQDLVNRVVAEQGKAVLDSPGKCRAFLSDYAKGQFMGEIRIFTEMLKGAYKNVALATNDDFEITKKRLIARIQNEFLVSEDNAAFFTKLLFNCLDIQDPVPEAIPVSITANFDALPDWIKYNLAHSFKSAH